MPEFLEMMEKWAGFRHVNTKQFGEAALARTINLLNNADRLPRHRHEFLLQEAVTTSDFPNLFGGVLDVTMYGLYRAALPEWRRYTPTGVLSDFRIADVEKVSGNEQLLAAVPEKTEYPLSAMAEGRYHRQLFKRGRQFDISWEAIVNDRLGAFDGFANRFASAALYTEAFLVTSMYCGAAAPNAALFGAPVVDAADGANVTNLGILPLTITNLATTLQLMASQVDVQGRPLGIRGLHLVVPPMLEFTARAILTSAFEQSTAAVTPLPTVNVMSQLGIQLHVDPLIPVVMPVAAANRTWFLFADTVQGKWGQMDFLRGHESPEICMKASNKASVGGGSIGPFEGDFETDDIMWRVRHCLGGSVLDPRMAYAQVGP